MRYVVKHISALTGKKVLIEREDGEIEIVLEFRREIQKRDDIFDWTRDWFSEHELVLPDDVWERYVKFRKMVKGGKNDAD